MLKFWKKSPAPPHDSSGEESAAVSADVTKAADLVNVPEVTRLAAEADPLPTPAALVTAVTSPAPPAKRSWMDRLRAGLKKTGAGITHLFVAVKVDEALFEDLESALLMADAGVEATEWLINDLRATAKRERIEDGARLKEALAEAMTRLLAPLEKPMPLVRADAGRPLIMLVAGVNGAGKTTTLGKLAKHFQTHGKTVLLAAGDTFRAAAREQLAIWGERNGVQVIAQEGGDPAAVVFDAISAGKARGFDIVMADTAGRLPTQLHLMEELKKVKRVIGRAEPGGPHEVLLVVDGNTGQNALAQLRAFDEAVGLTGLIVTKLDGTAKGGILCAVARTRAVPVYFVGMGEGLDDLQPFKAREFVDALLADNHPAATA